MSVMQFIGGAIAVVIGFKSFIGFLASLLALLFLIGFVIINVRSHASNEEIDAMVRQGCKEIFKKHDIHWNRKMDLNILTIAMILANLASLVGLGISYYLFCFFGFI